MRLISALTIADFSNLKYSQTIRHTPNTIELGIQIIRLNKKKIENS